MSEAEATETGTMLARAIFRCGDRAQSPCNRIQFKGGKWPDNETNQGGLCESALAVFIAKKLAEPRDAK